MQMNLRALSLVAGGHSQNGMIGSAEIFREE